MRGRRSGRRLGAVVLVLALATGACGPVVDLELPTAAPVPTGPAPAPARTVVYDADGGTLAVLRHRQHEPATLAALPRHLVAAVLTAEDRRFHEHRGVDGRAILRAAVANHEAGHAQQGGSTITQQLVKLRVMPDAERTAATKLQEAVTARQLERDRSKAAILEEYLNTVSFGEGTHGIAAAAWTYFGRSPDELDLAQAALLAAIIRAPEALAPTRAPEAARVRRDDVLRRMVEDGHLDTATAEAAIAQPVTVTGHPAAPETSEPHFVDFVLRTLRSDPTFGATEEERAMRLARGGLHIHTTLDPDLQASAREALIRQLGEDGPDGAIVIVEPATGAVRAAVGSRPYDDLQFDLATQARRQPGSTFKTFVLATALTDGWHPDDEVDGRQGTVRTAAGRWEVRNYDRHSYGSVSLAGATRASVNAAYARLAVDLGVDRVAGTAGAMGITSPVPADDPQIALGGGRLEVTPLELAGAYATLANRGRHVPTSPIRVVEDRDGHRIWAPTAQERPALAPRVAATTTTVLRDVVDAGTGLAARVDGWQVAGKTGTTSDHADAWFVGYTPTLAASVWVGHAEGRVPLRDVQGLAAVTGGTLPARIFAETLTAGLDGTEPVLWPGSGQPGRG